MKYWPGFLVRVLAPVCGWRNENFYDRLLFIEESHIGLKAKVGMDHTPGDVDFGYRRSVVAFIPKADAASNEKMKMQMDNKKKSITEEKRALEADLKLVIKAAKEQGEKEAVEQKLSDGNATSHVNTAILKARNAFMADRNVAMGETPDCPADLLDSGEPLSVISTFNADVQWFEATKVRTYFATGRAATRTACDVRAIKALVATPNE